eukprot:CAMPEP_0195006010 /NCGR_PEP_ID=MMETSP0326_2-20130528/6300_1 /TAXON_ID=2866 ORGANISM="Crypthecodinium cohnii, Strain Seligo" /NCGR_SAMPLE_ID=MMETSP0326_2 /ASSEMBLY_ACC=CAM_ASM_000348 /LENGTH=57 /DNA_ID=CAMNT_0040012529 /DNA_START=159 /DNA_END=328 /DNA_ORIENTATION=-
MARRAAMPSELRHNLLLVELATEEPEAGQECSTAFSLRSVGAGRLVNIGRGNSWPKS